MTHLREISIAVGAAASVALGYFLYKKCMFTLSTLSYIDWKKEEKCKCNKPEEETPKEDDKPRSFSCSADPVPVGLSISLPMPRKGNRVLHSEGEAWLDPHQRWRLSPRGEGEVGTFRDAQW